MRFLGRAPRREPAPYGLRPPYAEARAQLLSSRPAPVAPPDARSGEPLFAVVADIGLESYLVSLYLLADGTISIYTSDGIHSTGLRGAPKVAVAATAIVEDVEASLAGFQAVEDVSLLPLPERGDSQILVRTSRGDLAAFDRPDSKSPMVTRIAAMALILIDLARMSLVEGFERVEAGEVRYQLTPEYRRIRSSLMDWLPAAEQLPAAARVAGVTVEIGQAKTRTKGQTVTSLFAFADGSTSVYRSDGSLAQGLSTTPGVAEAARALLDSIEKALPAFGPPGLISLPQPGHVQFVARARSGETDEWTELLAVAELADLQTGLHPLSAAFARANEVLGKSG